MVHFEVESKLQRKYKVRKLQYYYYYYASVSLMMCVNNYCYSFLSGCIFVTINVKL